MKAMLKSELADAAGVSLSTMRTWLNDNETQLMSFGYKKNSKYLTPGVVRYLVDKYVINI